MAPTRTRRLPAGSSAGRCSRCAILRSPYLVDLHVQNGTTKVSLDRDRWRTPSISPGQHLRLERLRPGHGRTSTPLTGVPMPGDPAFSAHRRCSIYADKAAFRFEHFVGHVGSSDLEGTIAVAPGTPRRSITADLTSHRVDLTDLAGFLGGTPGKLTTPGQTPAARAAKVAKPPMRARNLLPTAKIRPAVDQYRECRPALPGRENH